jgi:ATP-dependent exoDNAse (exonuclease V) alpha subunit
VIQLINDYDNCVFNGDLGVVTSVRGAGKSYEFTVEFAERRREVEEERVKVDYRKSAVGQSISLAYALTVRAHAQPFPPCGSVVVWQLAHG